MNKYRKDINHRAEFARERWNEILVSFHPTDTISGYKARKLAQAYRIYTHYTYIFTGLSQKGTAVFKVMEQNTLRRKKNSWFKSRRQLASEGKLY